MTHSVNDNFRSRDASASKNCESFINQVASIFHLEGAKIKKNWGLPHVYTRWFKKTLCFVRHSSIILVRVWGLRIRLVVEDQSWKQKQLAHTYTTHWIDKKVTNQKRNLQLLQFLAMFLKNLFLLCSLRSMIRVGSKNTAKGQTMTHWHMRMNGLASVWFL